MAGGFISIDGPHGQYRAHALSAVDGGAQIGAETRIYPFAIVDEDAIVGDKCVIRSHATIGSATLGSNTFIGENSTIGDDAQLGDRVRIGACCVVGTDVQIGTGSVLEGLVSVPIDVTVGDCVFIQSGAKFPNDRNPSALGERWFGATELKIGSVIGANAVVLPGLKERPMIVPPFATLAAGSVATRPLTHPFAIYQGDMRIGWRDVAGRPLDYPSNRLPAAKGVLRKLEETVMFESGAVAVDEGMRIINAAEQAYRELAERGV